ncbi:hypothetical protein Cni_G11466 [Canna indica]|uniref:Uncharacterized protein n=1 Tax=Canna indica TaxID=4628 RepID=A0AAQ3KAB7_9LILI|nr:hypothetical protein Cni_G11466 [Canna indica]
MGRSPCCDESGIKKGPWDPEEDQKLIQFIQKNGHGSWRSLPKRADLNRCGKSCRLRWTNYLRPDIKRGKFSPEEEQTILHLHSILGNKWSAIATHLPGRTDNEIKNFWNTHLKKKLIHRGTDPMTHKPRMDHFATLSQLMALAKPRGIVEQRAWDDATRLQAEALRLAMQYFLRFPVSSTNTDISSMALKFDPMSLLSTQIPTTVTSPSLLSAATNSHPLFHHFPETPRILQQSLGNYMHQDSTALINNQEESNDIRAAVSPSLPEVAKDCLGSEYNCSSSSYDGSVASPLWSELFDCSLMTELI